MKALIRIAPMVLVGVFVALALGAGGGGKTTVWPAADVKWMDNPAMKGFWVAPLWGDPSKGAYGALKKAPAGVDFGWHTHTSDQKAVLISGTIELTLEGGSMQALTSGSYVALPGGTKHKTACRAGADCVWFEEQPGAADLVPVK